MDTSFPGGPSGQQTIPSHSGEQKPSVEGKTSELTFKLEPESAVLCRSRRCLAAGTYKSSTAASLQGLMCPLKTRPDA